MRFVFIHAGRGEYDRRGCWADDDDDGEMERWIDGEAERWRDDDDFLDGLVDFGLDEGGSDGRDDEGEEVEDDLKNDVEGDGDDDDDDEVVCRMCGILCLKKGRYG